MDGNVSQWKLTDEVMEQCVHKHDVCSLLLQSLQSKGQ